jgi:predicted ArsR family transcriptional regulator
VWVATDRGRAQFPNAYDQLAIECLDYLRGLGGEGAVAAFAEDKFAALERRYLALLEAEPDLAPAAALQRVLSAAGFMADVAPLRSGDQLLQHHCPYSAVASRFPEFCQAETAAFSRLVHSHVQRLATIAHGDGVCTTHIPHPVAHKEDL